jgi:hypothetical protein
MSARNCCDCRYVTFWEFRCGTPLCAHPKLDVVGYLATVPTCVEARREFEMCGHGGRLWEPKPEPKARPGFFSRIMRWV